MTLLFYLPRVMQQALPAAAERLCADNGSRGGSQNQVFLAGEQQLRFVCRVLSCKRMLALAPYVQYEPVACRPYIAFWRQCILTCIGMLADECMLVAMAALGRCHLALSHMWRLKSVLRVSHRLVCEVLTHFVGAAVSAQPYSATSTRL